MRRVVDPAIDGEFVADFEAYLRERGIPWRIPKFRCWEYGRVVRASDLRPEDTVLETGAMHTYLCVYVARFVARVIATDDFSWARRAYVSKLGLPPPDEWIRIAEKCGAGRVSAESADMMALPYADASFDKVLCVSTIEHVRDDEAAMREMARVLKRGGRLVMTTEFHPCRANLHTEDDVSRTRIYARSGVERLVRASGLRLDGAPVAERRTWLLARRRVNLLLRLRRE